MSCLSKKKKAGKDQLYKI